MVVSADTEDGVDAARAVRPRERIDLILSTRCCVSCMLCYQQKINNSFLVNRTGLIPAREYIDTGQGIS